MGGRCPRQWPGRLSRLQRLGRTQHVQLNTLSLHPEGGWTNTVSSAGLCGRCTGVAVPLRVVPSPTGLPSNKTQTVKSAQPLAQEAREGLEEGREGQGEGSREESPGAVGRSHTHAALGSKLSLQRDVVFLELRRHSRVTTGISAFPLGWPWEAQSSPWVAKESWGLRSSRVRLYVTP